MSKSLEIITKKIIGELSIIPMLIAILIFSILWIFIGFWKAFPIGIAVFCFIALFELIRIHLSIRFNKAKDIVMAQDQNIHKLQESVLGESIKYEQSLYSKLTPIPFNESGLIFHGTDFRVGHSFCTWIRGPICPKCKHSLLQWSKTIFFPLAFKCTCPCGFKKYFFKGTPESIYNHAKLKWEIDAVRKRENTQKSK